MSARRLVEEITKAAGGEAEAAECARRAEQAVNVRLEALFASKPSYNPCRRECILYSVRVLPEDFSFLTAERRRFAENSFLLHGYYIYRHLLIGRRMKRGKPEYVIMVPGRYQATERCMAELFGFTDFFPATQTSAHCKGLFGYWCVNI